MDETPKTTRYCVRYVETGHYKVTVEAVSEDDAIQKVTKAIDDGVDLGAIAFAGDIDVVSADPETSEAKEAGA